MEAIEVEAPSVAAADALRQRDPRDPWRHERALNWLDVTTVEQARLVLYGRCAATGRPWVLPTEPESFRMPEGYDMVDDETFWICQRLLGLGGFVEKIRPWSQVHRELQEKLKAPA